MNCLLYLKKLNQRERNYIDCFPLHFDGLTLNLI